MRYVASFSGGKDSLAMVLRLLEENKPLTNVVMYDTEMEYQAIYNNVNKISKILKEKGIELTILKPQNNWLYDMLVRPTKSGYGYKWCGGACRWRTSNKVNAINKYLKSFNEEYIQYVGIAYDEPKRAVLENNKVYPLIEWKMTEKECLKYCYDKGWNWNENGVELYDILDRVSCWCCKNKNLKELKNMHDYLPKYWNDLKGLQSLIKIPFKQNYSVFDLDNKFEKSKYEQLTIFDL